MVMVMVNFFLYGGGGDDDDDDDDDDEWSDSIACNGLAS